MAIALYMDVHVRRAVTVALRSRGIDVLIAQEDGTTRLSDPELLDRSSALGRVLFSQDEDLLAEASKRQRQGIAFSGVVFAHQLHVTVGQCVRDLEVIAKIGTPEDCADRVHYLPL